MAEKICQYSIAKEEKGSIVIIDDDKVNIDLLIRILTKEGYQARPCTSSVFGIQSVQTVLPDLILLDIKMPDLDGYEVCRRLKKDAKTSKIPVVFISALGETSNIVEGFNMGAIDYITKPIQPDEVLRRIQTHISLYRMQQVLESLVEKRTFELNRAYRTIVKREEQFSQFAKSISEVFWLFDIAQNKMIYVSPAYETVWGQPIGEGYTSSLCNPKNILSDDRIVLKKALNAIVEKKISEVSAEFRIIHPQNGIRWIGSKISPVYDQDEKIIRFAVVSSDITAIKEAAQKERVHLEQLMQADKMASLGFLVSSVAHEINNPINFIMLNTNYVRKMWENLAPKLKNYCEENEEFKASDIDCSHIINEFDTIFTDVINGCKRIQKIVAELKNYTKKDNYDLNQTIDLNQIVASAISLMDNMLKKYTQNFSLTLTETPLIVRGNFQKLEQVVVNLIQNACDSLASKEQGISIETYKHEDNKHAVVCVRDQGVGIPREDIDKITDPFFTTKADRGGTGLGLSISSKIIKDHKGEIEHRSTYGTGTWATIVLPMCSE